jgi:endoglucanase
MRAIRQGLAIASLLVAFLAPAAAAEPPPAPVFSERFTPIDADAEAAAMGPGVNVLGYDPGWHNPLRWRFMPEHFRAIRAAGFRHVRIVLQAFAFMDEAGTLDPKWLAQLDVFVKAALDAGLIVVLDEHDFTRCAADANACRTKLFAFWRQMAPRYAAAPNRLMFELLNEPHGALTAPLWNSLLADTLALVRTTNPDRNVVIGPSQWNGLGALPLLELPEADRHIIVTFHYYLPMEFTHQGAGFVGPPISTHTGVTWGTPAELQTLTDNFNKVQAWSAAHRRPIYLGEFGVYDSAAMNERVKWTTAMRSAAETRGFAFAWWQFDSDFVLWDFSKPGWVTPLLNALLPPAGASPAAH